MDLSRYVRIATLCTVSAFLGAGYSASAEGASRIPDGNAVVNPSFKQGAHNWSAFNARVRVIRSKRAPDGRTVARVAKRTGAAYTIDDTEPAVSTTTAGSRYRGAAWVRAGRKTAGRRVEVVLREVDPSGNFVDESAHPIRLTKRFRRVEVTHTAVADGNSLDIYVRQENADGRGFSFLVDAISVVGNDETPPVSNPPPDTDPPDTDPPETVPSPTGEDGPVTTNQIAIVNSQEDPLFQKDGSKYRYIVIRDSLHYRLDDLRAAHPESTILLYKDVSFTSDDGCQWAPFQGAGVDHCLADPHESWFLHRKDNPSTRIESDSYDGFQAMNLANSDYQRAWGDSVLARLQDAHDDGSGAKYDGVYMDDTNLFPGHGMNGKIAELSDAQYRQSTVSFISTVSPRVQAAGFETVVNLGMDPWEQDQADAAVQVAGKVTAINREGLVRWGPSGTLFTTDGSAPFWDDEVKLAERTQKAGANLQAITYGPLSDRSGQRYARATFLMAWNGRDGAGLTYRSTAEADSWGSEWTTDVGKPLSPRKAVGSGYLRSFTKGIVVINPASTGSQGFSLGGSFRDPDKGTCVSSISLPATTAAVMPAC